VSTATLVVIADEFFSFFSTSYCACVLPSRKYETRQQYVGVG